MKIRGQARRRSRRRLSPWAAEVTAGAIPSQVTTTKINATAQQAGPALEHIVHNSRPSDCEPAQLLVATEIDRELASLRRVEDGEATSYEILPSVDSPTVASSPDAAAGTADGLPAARRGDPGVHRHRLDATTGLRAPQAGRRFGHTKIQGKSLLVRGLNALAAAVSTPLSAPVIAATRLRGGNAASARGAASIAAQAIGTARDCGCTGDDHRPDGLGVLQRRGDRRDPPPRTAGSPSPCR